MDGIAISAVVPAYNRERQIERALRSILNQAQPPDEIIVVDDGSEDSTAGVAKSIPGVTVIVQPNSGAGPARNTGMQAASSEWVAFLDSDDEWNLEHMLRMRRAIRETEGRAALYFADVRLPASESATLWEVCGFSTDGEPYLVLDDAASVAFGPRHPMLLQGSVVHRATAHASGLFHPALQRSREDTHFFLALALQSVFCAVQGVGATMHEDAAFRLGPRASVKPEQYWLDTVFLYADLLGRAAGNPMAMNECRMRELHAWLRLADKAARDGRVADLVRYTGRAVLTDPSAACRRLAARAWRAMRRA